MNNEVYTSNDNKTPGKAVACLILGICSIVFACGGIGLVCSIVTLVLSGQLTKELGELPSQAKVGKVLAIIGLVLAVLAVIFWIVMAIVGVAAGASSYSYY